MIIRRTYEYLLLVEWAARFFELRRRWRVKSTVGRAEKETVCEVYAQVQYTVLNPVRCALRPFFSIQYRVLRTAQQLKPSWCIDWVPLFLFNTFRVEAFLWILKSGRIPGVCCRRICRGHWSSAWRCQFSPSQRCWLSARPAQHPVSPGPFPFDNLTTKDQRLQMWIEDRLTVLLSDFASTNSWSHLTRNHQNLEVCNSGIHLKYKTPISSSYFTTSKNGTTRQTDESWCLRRGCIPFSKSFFAG